MINRFLLIIKIFIQLLFNKKVRKKEYRMSLYSLAKRTKSNNIYQKMLVKYDKDINLSDIKKAEFISSGNGCGTLQICRKISFNNSNKTYFEKIYFNDSQEFKTMMYFYNNIYTYCKKLNFTPPKLEFVRLGNKLNITYYEFIHLKKIELNKRLNLSLKYYSQYSSLSFKHKFTSQNNYLLFTKQTRYLILKKQLIKYLSKIYPQKKVNILLLEIEKQIINIQHIFQHGDFHFGNIFYNCIIDWDTSGFYPIGYDLGFIFANEIKQLNLKSSDVYDFIFTQSNNLIVHEYLFSLKYFTMIGLTRYNINTVETINQIQVLFQEFI